MKDFLREYGCEAMFIICGTLVLITLFICFTIGQMNGKRHYYAAMDRCVTTGGTWVPTQNVGLCLSPGVTVRD